MAARARVRRFAVRAGAASAVLFTLIGLAHLPFARPVLRLLTGGGCPLGLDVALSPAQRDAARATALATVRGDAPAAARPALGFALDTTSRADIRAWASRVGVTCTDVVSTTHCADVPAAALHTAHARDGVTFQFDGADRLVAVSTEVGHLSADEAVALVGASSATIADTAGPVTASHGEPTGAWLARGALNQVSNEFRFTNYRAQVVATNLGKGGIAVREVYQSLGG